MIDFKTACRDIKELNPLSQQACRLFLEECEKVGVKIFITETYRSQERQDYLYAQGRTRSGGIVTYTTKSNHTSKMAWDIACSPPQDLYDSRVLQKAGVVANNLGIRWGGSCFGTFKDSPHFEILSTWKVPVKAPTYSITKIKVDLFGEIKTVDGININDTNHIKLRDLNCNDIKVEWKNGSVYVNSKVFKVDGILYQDTNYVKIRSLEQIGIKVTWDNVKKIIVIR